MKTQVAVMNKTERELTFEELKKEVLTDLAIIIESREASLLGRKEVLTGKAKFGIFGDGKELAQIAMAKVFQEGDFRSGYYRDQTFMFAAGLLTLEQWFAQLYAHTNLEKEPSSGGRQMNGHYSTRFLNPDGSFRDLTKLKNSSSDISPTGSQMPRLLGLAYASHFFRNNAQLQTIEFSHLSRKGNEIAFGTIGDASTSEGLFWETINAAGVLQVPMLVSVWDDGHGISVPKKYQTTKESISEILKGFKRDGKFKGYEIFKTRGWDYVHLIKTYEDAAEICRTEHVPVLVHVEEMTQPQGHSTSGSHERYKSRERLEWEQEFDCIKKMSEWVIRNNLASESEISQIQTTAVERVKAAKKTAWEDFTRELKEDAANLYKCVEAALGNTAGTEELLAQVSGIGKSGDIEKRLIIRTGKKILRQLPNNPEARKSIGDWLKEYEKNSRKKYNSHLYSENEKSALNIPPVSPEYPAENQVCDGREILRDNFDAILSKYPEVMIFGEDSGKIGGVNQGLEGLQKKFGEIRVFDTGIREATIIGQAIGLAMRGLRPIAEIQYLDYLPYVIQIMTDDLATVHYRTVGGQKAPVIIRTRGHRLEGIWHSGSPMGMIINSVRGMHVCVPRNMTKAAGFYNTLLCADEPALIIEPLNSYRLKEPVPSNWGAWKTPLGIPEIIKAGTDVTLVTYGPNCRIALEAATQLEAFGIAVEIIDVQTLLPFDINHIIVNSLQKTNRIIFVDEDVPGGASAFMLKKVLEDQEGFRYLDSAPVTVTAEEHRPAYGTDGDYFSKPNTEMIFDAVWKMMHEADPNRFPAW
jgi:2-oxoisovalerate dehydrogenase E1 component